MTFVFNESRCSMIESGKFDELAREIAKLNNLDEDKTVKQWKGEFIIRRSINGQEETFG